MSCSSAIYTDNNSTQTVDINSVIGLGTIIRRYGKDLNQAGNGILAGGRGYYEISGIFILAPTAAGIVGVQIVADGVEVPGAVSKVTGTAGTMVTIPVQGIFRMTCCEQPTSIQFKLIGDSAVTSATVSNANVIIKKI